MLNKKNSKLRPQNQVWPTPNKHQAHHYPRYSSSTHRRRLSLRNSSCRTCRTPTFISYKRQHLAHSTFRPPKSTIRTNMGNHDHTDAASNLTLNYNGEGDRYYTSTLDARFSLAQPPFAKRRAQLSTGALIGVIVGRVAMSALVVVGVICCNSEN